MSWTDKKAIKTIKQLRDDFKVKTFIETGTFKGVNMQFHTSNFANVFSCELVKTYWLEAIKRMRHPHCPEGVFHTSSRLYNQPSPLMLRHLEKTKPYNGTPIFYLDAHFYDPKLPKSKRFVVLDELKELKGNKDCIIIIHDFANGLGHITYDGIPLDFKLLKRSLLTVNPNFHFYTNELSGCDIVKPTKKDILAAGLPYDKDVIDNLKYAWKEPRLTYRGILYCTPKKLELNKYELREL